MAVKKEKIDYVEKNRKKYFYRFVKMIIDYENLEKN